MNRILRNSNWKDLAKIHGKQGKLLNPGTLKGTCHVWNESAHDNLVKILQPERLTKPTGPFQSSRANFTEGRGSQLRSSGRNHGSGGKIEPPSVPMEELEIEQGFVSNLREKFGFIECADRDGQMFFHISELCNDEGELMEHGIEGSLYDLI